jgi:hypothetical protein
MTTHYDGKYNMASDLVHLNIYGDDKKEKNIYNDYKMELSNPNRRRVT